MMEAESGKTALVYKSCDGMGWEGRKEKGEREGRRGNQIRHKSGAHG